MLEGEEEIGSPHLGPLLDRCGQHFMAEAGVAAHDPFAQFCARVAGEYYGQPALIFPTEAATIGLSTMRRYLPYSILLTPGAPGYWGSNIHAPNEHIRIADLQDSIKFHVLFFARFSEIEP